MINRLYNLEKLIKKQKVLVIYGPRRVGKTTLLNDFLSKTKLKFKLDSGDNIKVQHILKSQDFARILEYAGDYKLIALDEAQQIPNIGMGLKILVDQVQGLCIIATGSASFALSQQIGEPLTGRKKTIILYPLSQKELLPECNNNKFELRQKLEEFLVFGSYPEVITARTKAKKIDVLKELADSYLLKDVFALEKIKNSVALLNLLKLVAFQIGSEVSLNELATQVKLDVKTVERYLDIMEKAFVLKKVGAFSRNLRKEIYSKNKYYFYDNGARNAVISQFNDLKDRNDVGALWENFIVMERLKKQEYNRIYSNNYFWRTYDHKEIDWVEEREGKLFGYEIKWGNKKHKEPKLWKDTYSNAEFQVINQDNYFDFII
ncbi:MAG: ATP-binding protein [Candidatus Pacebacteria bacterium]|nr:ATP-binding protein [Candidatus Paceibacterota bacterium]